MDVTNKVVPELNLSHFLDEKYYSKHGREMDLHPEGITFEYRLDVVGAPIFVFIDLERFVLTNTNPSVFRELIKNIKYQNIPLVWDKEKNRFRFAEKGLFDLIKQKELLDRIK
jgi:hypothetical protein